jgi:hypothetical protein
MYPNCTYPNTPVAMHSRKFAGLNLHPGTGISKGSDEVIHEGGLAPLRGDFVRNLIDLVLQLILDLAGLHWRR